MKCDLTICRFQNQLPQEINKRPQQFLTQEELIKLMDWKLTVSYSSSKKLLFLDQELKDWLGYNKIVHGFVMSSNISVLLSRECLHYCTHVHTCAVLNANKLY